MENQLIVKIFDTNLTWLGLIEEVSSLTLRTSFCGIETSELKIKRRVNGVDLITVGSILVFNNQRDRACIVEDMSSSLEDDEWTFTLLPLKAMLNYRIIEGSTFTWTNQPQATVMTALVNRHGVVASNTSRRFPNFQLGTSNTFGDNITYTEDYLPLGDKLTEIAMMSDDYLGWNVVINSDYTKFVFETYQGTDKSDSVVFSEEYGNLKNATYNRATKDFKNWVYVGDSHTQVGDGTATGFDRRELAIDSSQDDTNASSQTAEGKAELNERRLRDTFDAEILDNENTMSTYRVHWNVGDKVRIQSDVLNVQIVKQVTVLEELYYDNSYSMNVTFGEGEVTFTNLIKGAIREGNGRKITTISGTVDWSNIANKPSTFPPSAHTHPISDVTGLQTALDSKAPTQDPTFSGTIKYTDGVTTQNLMQIKTGDSTGFMTAISTHGGFVVSAGESGDAILADGTVSATGEHLYLSADSSVRMYSNANTYASRHELVFDNTGKLAMDGNEIYASTPTFTNLTLQNGATVNNSRTPRYTKRNGIVYVEGEISAIANSTVIATLPVGYRPNTYSLNFACAHATATANYPVIFSVNTAGQIQVVSGNGTNGYALNNIHFIAEA